MTHEEVVKAGIDTMISRLPAEDRYAVMECKVKIQAVMMLYKREISALALASIGANAVAAIDNEAAQ
jgi:hypothetical protein